MKTLVPLLALALAIGGCDSSTLTGSDNTSELVDDAVVGAKPTRVPVAEESASGWSGSATLSRTNQDQLRWGIHASGTPETQNVLLCLKKDGNYHCGGYTSNKSGKINSDWFFEDIAPGATVTFTIQIGATVLASSGPVSAP